VNHKSWREVGKAAGWPLSLPHRAVPTTVLKKRQESIIGWNRGFKGKLFLESKWACLTVQLRMAGLVTCFPGL